MEPQKVEHHVMTTVLFVYCSFLYIFPEKRFGNNPFSIKGVIFVCGFNFVDLAKLSSSINFRLF